MKYGFLSDVHGDLEGLERALDCLREADRLVFLGDVLGGRHDRECLARLRSIPDLISVPGNHDLWDCELTGLPCEFQDYLRGLTLEQEVEDWLAVHSDYECDPGGAVRFPYIHSEIDARRAFDHFPQRLIFFGHTHLSQVHRLDPDGRIEFRRAPGFTLAPNSRYLINVGMAAQAVLLFDCTAQRIDYRTFT